MVIQLRVFLTLLLLILPGPGWADHEPITLRLNTVMGMPPLVWRATITLERDSANRKLELVWVLGDRHNGMRDGSTSWQINGEHAQRVYTFQNARDPLRTPGEYVVYAEVTRNDGKTHSAVVNVRVIGGEADDPQ